MGRGSKHEGRHGGESEATAKEKADQEEQVFIPALGLVGGRCPHHVGKCSEVQQNMLTLDLVELKLTGLSSP